MDNTLSKYRQDNLNKKLLKYCSNSASLSIIIELVELGADVNCTDVLKSSPLIIAVKVGFYKCAEYLIKKGANINVKDENGIPLIFYAFSVGDYLFNKYKSKRRIVDLLIEKEADLTICDDDGNDISSLRLKLPLEYVKNNYPKQYKTFEIFQEARKFNI